MYIYIYMRYMIYIYIYIVKFLPVDHVPHALPYTNHDPMGIIKSNQVHASIAGEGSVQQRWEREACAIGCRRDDSRCAVLEEITGVPRCWLWTCGAGVVSRWKGACYQFDTGSGAWQ